MPKVRMILVLVNCFRKSVLFLAQESMIYCTIYFKAHTAKKKPNTYTYHWLLHCKGRKRILKLVKIFVTLLGKKGGKKLFHTQLSKEWTDHHGQATSQLLQPWYSSIKFCTMCLIHTFVLKHDLCNQLYKKKVKGALKKLMVSKSVLRQHSVSETCTLFSA